MREPPSATPTAADAAVIVRRALHQSVLTVRRFPTGLAHYVFEVVTANGQKLAVRIARPDERINFAGALYWSSLLRPKGVPLPEIVYADPCADHYHFPAMVLERLPGTDLGYVYPNLSSAEKGALAAEIVRVQKITAELPEGSGFGYAVSYEQAFPHQAWSGVVHSSLSRSRSRIERAGLVDPRHVDRLEALSACFAPYFGGIPPRAFLDDTTTKNVIICNGKLSGIVDVDVVCFGDPLLTVGLTQMALLSDGRDLLYIDYWCALLDLSPEQHHALHFYTALFCLDFMSELGHAHNRDRPASADAQRAAHLIAIFDNLLASLHENKRAARRQGLSHICAPTADDRST